MAAVTGYFKEFQKTKYNSIKTELLGYRLSPFIRDKESQTGVNKGLIFPFARGLRFSALLIYAIRESLSGSDLEVNWGQIVDDSGLACSGECDIIIHKKGHEEKWNGGAGGHHVMDFRFIHKNNALVVISCKSYLANATVEKDYCENILKYVKNVWLFAECCGPESVKLIKNNSKKIGYKNFWYLYTWSRKTDKIVDDEKGWYHFIETVKKLGITTLKTAPKKAVKKAAKKSLKGVPKKAAKKTIKKVSIKKRKAKI
ncbi:MAG: hypothetical protein JWO09_1141 [Bacteroidetes bacterium]|nr:hypothetical protein [Bacteroidota bacterium]